MLTDSQKAFIQLSKKQEKLKEELKENGKKLEELLLELGEGTSFQDPTDKVVFEVVIPDGRFISYPKISYNRTKREGERAGSLSVKKAKELGFDL